MVASGYLSGGGQTAAASKYTVVKVRLRHIFRFFRASGREKLLRCFGARAFPEKKLKQVYPVFRRGIAADCLGFFLTLPADTIYTDVVLLAVKKLLEFRAQGDHFFFIEMALEQAVLCPLAEPGQSFVHFCAPSIIGDVISN